MKRYGIILLNVILLSIIINVQVYASEWIDLGIKENVSINKEWTITFSHEMDRKSLHNHSVYVVDEEGNKQFLATYLSDDRKKLTVKAPVDYYDPGKTYTLFVDADAEGMSGLSMERGYKMTFSIDPDEQKPSMLPEDDDAIFFATVTVETSLNVRSGPSTATESLGKVYNGDVLAIYAIDGYWVETKFEGKKAYLHKDYLKLRNANGKFLDGINIVIDAGHGGKDSGAIVKSPLVYEKDIVFPISLNIKERLERLGANVILTRSTDDYIDLDERVELSKNQYNDLFVSIHANASSDSNAYGSETYYSEGKSDNVVEGRLLATTIQQQMLQMAEVYNRGAKASDFRVIKNNSAPAVLVELGFMTNSNDLKKLTDPNYQQLYADSITQGIINYYLK
ncbi:N-acetylmuramoyl-L-alanine amidase [Bacillaceae bacterium W0354]